eukprot:5889364-Amphidinium_carterae.1
MALSRLCNFAIILGRRHWSALGRVPEACFVSRDLVVTHGMALWEMQNYPTVLHGMMGRDDKVLQYISAYWGAAHVPLMRISRHVCVFGNPCAIFKLELPMRSCWNAIMYELQLVSACDRMEAIGV